MNLRAELRQLKKELEGSSINSLSDSENRLQNLIKSVQVLHATKYFILMKKLKKNEVRLNDISGMKGTSEKALDKYIEEAKKFWKDYHLTEKMHWRTAEYQIKKRFKEIYETI